MAYPLSPEDRALFESWLKKAEPYAEDDPIINTLDGEHDQDRVMATLAKMILEGKLRKPSKTMKSINEDNGHENDSSH